MPLRFCDGLDSGTFFECCNFRVFFCLSWLPDSYYFKTCWKCCFLSGQSLQNEKFFPGFCPWIGFCTFSREWFWTRWVIYLSKIRYFHLGTQYPFPYLTFFSWVWIDQFYVFRFTFLQEKLTLSFLIRDEVQCPSQIIELQDEIKASYYFDISNEFH